MSDTRFNHLEGSEQENGYLPFVSVVIPVYNDTDRLKICLNALEKQTYDPERYEIIVVDNGSDANEGLEPLSKHFQNVTVIQELTPGSYAARNKGLEVSKGEIIAFTDADCIPAPDWLSKGIQCFIDNPNCGMVGGRIDMFFQDPDNISPAALYDYAIVGFPQETLIKELKQVITANAFTQRHVIENVGNFDQNLRSSGDREWGARVFSAGYDQFYAEDVLVAHPVRSSVNELCRRMARFSGGIYGLYVNREQSILVRNRRFLRLVIEDLTIYNFRVIKKVLSSPYISQPEMRLKVTGIAFWLQLISAYEKIKLRFGAEPQRQ